MPLIRPLVARALPALAVLAAAAAARADVDARTCVSAAERGQVLRQDGKLLEARAEFLVCASDACPHPVHRDCSQWITELDASVPSVVPALKHADGREITDARVLLDGQLLADKTIGLAIPVDPGPHRMRFEPPGAPPIDMDVVIHEGEKNRLLSVTVPDRAPSAPAPAPAPAPAEAAPEHGATRPIPPLAFATGGLALAAGAGFAALALMGTSDLRDMRATCVDLCAPSAVDAARTKLLVGDILLGVGLISAGVTAWLVLTRPSSARPAAPVALDVAPSPGGGFRANARLAF